jgi:hypothetical protein
MDHQMAYPSGSVFNVFDVLDVLDVLGVSGEFVPCLYGQPQRLDFLKKTTSNVSRVPVMYVFHV